MKHDNNQTTTTVQPSFFEELAAATVQPSKSRQLAFTASLNALSQERSVAMTKNLGIDHPELTGLANRCLSDANATDAFELIQTVYSEQLESDVHILADCPVDDLPKMLECARSKRSNAKKAGLQSGLKPVLDYFAAVYSEMLIRKVTGKEYAGNTGVTSTFDVTTADDDQIKRKIASLSSKASRLRRTSQFITKDAEQLEIVEAELQELRNLRGTTKTASIKPDKLLAELNKLDQTEMNDDQLKAMQAVMAMLNK